MSKKTWKGVKNSVLREKKNSQIQKNIHDIIPLKQNSRKIKSDL